MTLVIGLKAKNGIVLASDSKASSDLTSNDTVQKVFPLGENSAVGISGDGGLAVYFLDQVKDKLNYGTGIKDLAEQVRKHGKEKFNDFFEHLSPEKRPGMSLLLVGYTKEGKAEIYTLRSQDNFVPRKCVTGFECIGIPYIAEYLLNRLYEKDITTRYGAEMSVLCISETKTQDDRVGGPTRVGRLEPSKSFQEFSATDIREMEKEANKFQVKRKSRFYPEDPDSGSDSLG